MKFYVLSIGVLTASLMAGTAQAAPVHFSGDDGDKFVPPFFDDSWKPSGDKGKSHGDDGDDNHGNLGNFLADVDGDDHHHHHKHHDDFRFISDHDHHHDYNYNCDPGGPSPTPLPGSLALFGTGLMALGAFGFSRRSRRRAS